MAFSETKLKVVTPNLIGAGLCLFGNSFEKEADIIFRKAKEYSLRAKINWGEAVCSIFSDYCEKDTPENVSIKLNVSDEAFVDATNNEVRDALGFDMNRINDSEDLFYMTFRFAIHLTCLFGIGITERLVKSDRQRIFKEIFYLSATFSAHEQTARSEAAAWWVRPFSILLKESANRAKIDSETKVKKVLQIYGDGRLGNDLGSTGKIVFSKISSFI
jgi:hypothetical protein